MCLKWCYFYKEITREPADANLVLERTQHCSLVSLTFQRSNVYDPWQSSHVQ